MADINERQIAILLKQHADAIEGAMERVASSNMMALSSLVDRKFKDRKISKNEAKKKKSDQEAIKAQDDLTQAKKDETKATEKNTDSMHDFGNEMDRGIRPRIKEFAKEMGSFSTVLRGAKVALDEMKTVMSHAGQYDPFQAMKMGMGSKELTELQAKHRQAALAMSGGVTQFTKNVSSLQNDLMSRVGDMPMAAKVAAETMDQAQSVGVKVGVGTDKLVTSLVQNMKDMQDVTGDTLEVLSANNRSLIQSNEIRSELMGLDDKQRQEYTKNMLTLQTWNRTITSSNEEAQELTKSFVRMQAESPIERIKRAAKMALMAESQGLITSKERERMMEIANMGKGATARDPRIAAEWQTYQQKIAEGTAKGQASDNLSSQVFFSELAALQEPYAQSAQAVAMAAGKEPIEGAAQNQERLTDGVFGEAVVGFATAVDMFEAAVASGAGMLAMGTLGQLAKGKWGRGGNLGKTADGATSSKRTSGLRDRIKGATLDKKQMALIEGIGEKVPMKAKAANAAVKLIDGGLKLGRGALAGGLVGTAVSLAADPAIDYASKKAVEGGANRKDVQDQGRYAKSMMTGASIGATIGSFIAPGIGTAVGGAVGGTMGAVYELMTTNEDKLLQERLNAITQEARAREEKITNPEALKASRQLTNAKIANEKLAAYNANKSDLDKMRSGDFGVSGLVAGRVGGVDLQDAVAKTAAGSGLDSSVISEDLFDFMSKTDPSKFKNKGEALTYYEKGGNIDGDVFQKFLNSDSMKEKIEEAQKQKDKEDAETAAMNKVAIDQLEAQTRNNNITAETLRQTIALRTTLEEQNKILEKRKLKGKEESTASTDVTD